MATLLETYKGRLKIAERMYAQQHQGEKLSESKKLATAKLLQNTSRFLTEAFGAQNATQTGIASTTSAAGTTTLGQFKKFAMNLVNVVVPNLIANDISIVYPMSSMSGYLNYIKYSVGEPKSEYELNDMFLDPWHIGKVHNPSYTGQAVVEEVDNSKTLAWTPILAAWNAETGEALAVADDKSELKEAFTGKVKYIYDNVIIPQAKLPMLKAEMKAIPLLAHARRIAVYYSQIAAFQA